MAKETETPDIPADDSLFDASEYETPEVDDSSPAVDVSTAGVDEPAVAPSLAALLRQREFEISEDASDDDVIARMEELEAAAEEREQLRQQLEQYKAYQAQQQARPQAEPTAPAAPAAKSEDELPAAPKLDEVTLNLVNFGLAKNEIAEGPGGVYTTTNPSLAHAVQKANEFLVAQKEYLREWRENPYQAVDKRLQYRLEKEREEIRQWIKTEFQTGLSQKEAQDYLKQFATEHGAWLYRDGGQFSPVGDLFNRRLSEHLSRGVAPADAVRYAKYDTKEATGQSPWEVDADGATPTPTDKKVALRRKAKTNGHNRLKQAPVTPRRAAPSHVPTGPVSPRELQRSWEAEINQALGETE